MQDELISKHLPALEDFWHRREWDAATSQPLTLLGQPFKLRCNDARLVEAVTHALTAFSQAKSVDAPAFTLNIAVQSQGKPPGTPPRDLYASNTFFGGDNWLMIHAGVWGHAHINLESLTATVVVTPQLAADADILARGLLHTVFTNLLFAAGYAMLHCTALLRNSHLLLLMAPHNSGKSTTALRLALSGLKLLSDSQVYVSPHHRPLHIMGFPVGRARLRNDMLSSFPQLHDFLQPEAVRGETKFSFKLQDFDPSLVQQDAVAVETVDLCLLKLHDSAETTLTPATQDELWQAVMQNSLFFDSKANWQKNLATVTPLIERATPYHLSVGSDAAKIIHCIEELLTGR